MRLLGATFKVDCTYWSVSKVRSLFYNIPRWCYLRSNNKSGFMDNYRPSNATRMEELWACNWADVAWFYTAFAFNCISFAMNCISKHSHLKWPVACVALLAANANGDRAIPGQPVSLNREKMSSDFLH